MARTRHLARYAISAALAGATSSFALIASMPTAMAQSAEAFGLDEEDTGEVLFEADDVYRMGENAPIIAEGNVRAFFGGRYLRADKLTYDPLTDVVTAEGNVSITDEDLETMFAGRVIVSGDMRDGIVENFSALLVDNARIAADNATQEQGARTKLNRVVYTACNVCNKDGEAKIPTWRIKALRAVRDRERRVVRFHHAFLELKGVPILYTPFLQGPDPSVERQSGFLTPLVRTSSRIGFNFELPYYLALSDSQDATFYPKYTSKDGVLWQGEYRRRFKRGYHIVQAGLIDAPNQPEPTPEEPTTTPGVRWHAFGRGYQEFGDNWRASYDLERISDKEYLRLYNIRRRGGLAQQIDHGAINQLRSNFRIARTTENSRLSIDTYAFQGLRGSDDVANTPYALPLINYEQRLGKVAGGETALRANIASIYRVEGTDSQRFTAAANWDRDIITKGGHRFHLFAEARGDMFFYQDLNEGTEQCDNPLAACADDFVGLRNGETTDQVSRFAPSAGVEWSYPLASDAGGARLMLEPRVQLVASMENRNDPRIINEDSQSIEFDYAGLFDFNKATGYDIFEDGQRANVGLSASVAWENGIEIETAVGRQFRLQTTDAFDLASGLGDTSSDFVGDVNFRFKDLFGIENRFRYDAAEKRFPRIESAAFLNAGPVRTSATYVRLLTDNPAPLPPQAPNRDIREELTANTRINLTKNWYVGGAWRLNLAPNLLRDPETGRFPTDPVTGVLLPPPSSRTINQDFTLGYNDECMTVGVTYRRDRTRTTNLRPDESFLITFTLRSLVQ